MTVFKDLPALSSAIFSVFGVFNNIANSGAIVTDFPFRLCYIFTSGCLFLFCSLLGIKNAFEKTIVCHVTGKKTDQQLKAINQYCWVTGTYTGETGNVHSYYQWVPYMLLLQGCLFYLPKILWDQFEQGRMNKICNEILSLTKISKDYSKKVKEVADKVTKYIKLEQAGHFLYGIGYLCSQVLNLLVLFFCVFITDRFLDGQFYDLGSNWVQALSYGKRGESSSQLEEIFPRMASCNFKSTGFSGLTNIDNPICVLAPNALSEKFFVFLWFWYHFMIVVVGTNLILVIAMMFKSTTIRKIYASRYIFKEKMPKDGDEFHQKARNIFKENELDKKLAKLNLGQFLFLQFVGQNVGHTVFKSILETLAMEDRNIRMPELKGLISIPNGIPMDILPANVSNDSSRLPSYQSETNSHNDLVENLYDEDIGNSELLNINTVDGTPAQSRKELNSSPPPSNEINQKKKIGMKNPFVFKRKK